MNSADYAEQAEEKFRSEQIAVITATKKPVINPSGECVECGDQIPPARLALVSTDMCACCAGIKERK